MKKIQTLVLSIAFIFGFLIHGNAWGSETTKRVKVLSLDGGGMRGVLITQILIALQEKLIHPIAHHFDIIGGTSTGGILALGLTIPQDGAGDYEYNGNYAQPKFTPEEMGEVYTERGGKIFERSCGYKLWSCGGARKSKYPVTHLEQELEEKFGDRWICDAVAPTVITATRKGEPFIMKSWKADDTCGLDPADHPKTRDFKMRDAGRATGAAPTYFKEAFIKNKDGIPVLLADGGLYANNPLDVIAGEAYKLFPENPKHLYISIGTGEEEVLRPAVGEGDEDVRDACCYGGIFYWATEILDRMFSASSKKTNYIAKTIEGAEGKGHRFFRFNFEVAPEHMRMDDASQENIAYLINLGKETAKKYDTELEEIAAILNTEPRLPIPQNKNLKMDDEF